MSQGNPPPPGQPPLAPTQHDTYPGGRRNANLAAAHQQFPIITRLNERIASSNIVQNISHGITNRPRTSYNTWTPSGQYTYYGQHASPNPYPYQNPSPYVTVNLTTVQPVPDPNRRNVYIICRPVRSGQVNEEIQRRCLPLMATCSCLGNIVQPCLTIPGRHHHMAHWVVLVGNTCYELRKVGPDIKCNRSQLDEASGGSKFNMGTTVHTDEDIARAGKFLPLQSRGVASLRVCRRQG